MSQERREAERVSFKVTAVVSAGDKKIESESTENLSVKGVFVNCADPLEVGSLCQVQLELTGWKSKLNLEMEGKVSRAIPGQGIGIEFTSLDIDCYAFLKHVVEYNQPEEENVPVENLDI